MAPVSQRLRTSLGLLACITLVFMAVGISRASAPKPVGPSTVLEEPISGMRLRLVPAGTFEMGSPATEPLREAQERRHTVRLSRSFYLGETEVTQEQWERVLGPGRRPSQAAACGARCPVENVSFEEVQEFLRQLNANAAGRFRLPTEAEWEYACRAGTTTPFSTGSGLTTDEANVHGGHPYPGGKLGPFRGGPTPVGSFPPNAWGLFDLHGNVWEWCEDWHCPYGDGPATDPIGRCASELRIIRGGSWAFGADSARCALRYTHRPQDRGPSLGFRVARDAP
jgi:formylglycine-generating enzyme required for sulfatase activity